MRTTLSESFRGGFLTALERAPVRAPDVIEKADPAGGKDPVRRQAAFKAWETRERGKAEHLRVQAEAARRKKDFAVAAGMQRKVDEILEAVSVRRRAREAGKTIPSLAKPARRPPAAAPAPPAPKAVPKPPSAKPAPPKPEPPKPEPKREPKPEPKPPSAEAKPLRHPQNSVAKNLGTIREASADNSKISSLKRISGKQNVGQVYVVKFADGTRGIFKPTQETGLAYFKYERTGKPLRRTIDKDPPEARREMAAYQISAAAGFDVVPPVEIVDYGKEDRLLETRREQLRRAGGHAERLGLHEQVSSGEGHVMAFVAGRDPDEIPYAVMDAERGHTDRHRIVALDIITANTDRHGHNFRRGDDGRWYAIDNGMAFPRDMEVGEFRNDALDSLSGSKIPESVREEILSLSAERLDAIMTTQGFGKRDVRSAGHRLRALKHFAGRGVWPPGEHYILDLASKLERAGG